MSLAEVFLRLACALVAWMLILAYVVWLAALPQMDCAQSGDDLWQLLHGFACMALLGGWLAGLTAKLPEIHTMLRWLTWPVGLLLLLGVSTIVKSFSALTLGGESPCNVAPAAWHDWWAPLQALAVVMLALLLWRNYVRVNH